MTALSSLVLALTMTVGASGPTADDLLRSKSGVPFGGLAPLSSPQTSWNPDGIHFTFTAPQEVTVRVLVTRANPDREAEFHLTRYNVDVEVKPPAARQVLRPVIDRIVERLRLNESQGPTLRKVRGEGPEKARAPTAAGKHDDRKEVSEKKATGGTTEDGSTDSTDYNIELWICLLALLGALMTLPWAIEEVRQSLASQGRALLALALASLAVVAIQLFGVPHELVTVFAGYGALEQAYQLEPMAKYGATSTVLYGPLLHLFGPNTDVMIGANLALGLMTVFMAAALAIRLGGPALKRPFNGAIAVLVIGIAPVLMHDRGTESVLVPMQFFVLGSLLHLETWLRTGQRVQLVAWGFHSILALNARPEAFVVLPILWVAMASLEGGWTALKNQWKSMGLAAGIVALIALSRVMGVLEFMDAAAQSGDVPGLAKASSEGFWAAFTEKNLLFRPLYLSPALGAIAVAALFLAPKGRRLTLGLVWLASLVWIALSTLDLPEVSISRVQAPAASWVIVMACVGIFALRSLVSIRWAGVVATSLCLFPWPGSVQALWAPTNAKVFDGFWKRALPHVEPTGKKRCLIGLSMSDEPTDIVTRLYPSTSLAVRSGGLNTFGIETFLEAPDVVLREQCEPLYIVGPQCWAKFHGFGGDEPPEAVEHPQCQRMRQLTVLEPLYEEELPNMGNADFPFYGASETFTYGVYRVTGLKLSL
jgi:hypothetical protein